MCTGCVEELVLADPSSESGGRFDRWLRIVLPAVTVVATFVVRTWGISRHSWVLGDQVRDWGIALGSFTQLPLVGPPTHVHGYTIGPAFYWILWAIRVVVGPWFQNLPHAGGIGEAALQSAVDALLLLAIWKRTQSVWLSLTAVVLLTTGSFDLAISATVWNPTVGSILAKAATTLVLLNWHRRSLFHAAITAAIAWCAVHAYTGAVFVALGVFAALIVDPLSRGDRRTAWQNSLAVLVVVTLLQVPYFVHQLLSQPVDSGMTAVAISLGNAVASPTNVRLGDSARAYTFALEYLQLSPWHSGAILWVVAACGVSTAVRHRRDPVLLAITLLPQIAALIGYGFWIGDLEAYYYLSLMPAAVLTILLGVSAVVPRRAAQAVGCVLLAAAVLLIPARLQFAATLFRMPAYEAFVRGSRTIVRYGRPMRAVRASFDVPPTSDPEFIFTILGGRIEHGAPWWAEIAPDSQVMYHRADVP
jgi:hypothetical protein